MTGTLTRVSVSSTGGQGELDSLLPSLSDDGTVVAFASAATLLSAEPDPVVCINSPPACTRPFLVGSRAGARRGGSRPVDRHQPCRRHSGGPLTILPRRRLGAARRA